MPLIGFSPIFSGFGSVITAGRATPVDGTRLVRRPEGTSTRSNRSLGFIRSSWFEMLHPSDTRNLYPHGQILVVVERDVREKKMA